MCLLLQVLQPFRDFVWGRRGGPPPGPAIATRIRMFGATGQSMEAAKRIPDEI